MCAVAYPGTVNSQALVGVLVAAVLGSGSAVVVTNIELLSSPSPTSIEQASDVLVEPTVTTDPIDGPDVPELAESGTDDSLPPDEQSDPTNPLPAEGQVVDSVVESNADASSSSQSPSSSSGDDHDDDDDDDRDDDDDDRDDDDDDEDHSDDDD